MIKETELALEKTLITTGKVARQCQVTVKTVNNWIKTGSLKACTTPGRHHRIHIVDFKEFLQRHGMPPLEEESPSSARPRVLVVDDDEGVVLPIASYLRLNGYEVSTALNGFNAGLEVERFKPDLVILDLMMPYMDGFEVCKWIKADSATEHIKLLILTGYTEEGFIEQAKECGADDWLAKPASLSELLGKAEQLIKQGSATQRQ